MSYHQHSFIIISISIVIKIIIVIITMIVTTFQTNFGTKCAKCNLFVEGEVVSALGNTFHQVTVLDIDFYLFTFFSSLTRNMFPPPGLFHVRAMQTTFSNRRASYFYWEELSLSGLHTGGGIVIVVTIIIIMAA